MGRTLEALRRIEARGLPLAAPASALREEPPFFERERLQVASGERLATVSLDRAEAAVALAIDDYAWGAHRPIPPIHWSDVGAAAATEVAAQSQSDQQPVFVPEPQPSPTATEPIVLSLGAGNLDAYRTLRSRLVTRQSAAGGSVLLLAASSSAVGRGFSAASLAIVLAELELGEVLMVDQIGPQPLKSRRGGNFERYLHWQQELRATTEPQVQVLPADADFFTSAALHNVCLWDCLRERFRFVLLGPWLAGDPALGRIAKSHDGAVLLLGWNESQRTARRALRQLAAGGSRVLGCAVAA